MTMPSSSVSWILSCFLFLVALTCSLDQCSEDRGGGFCPAGNTCCLRYDGMSGCIPNDLGSNNATCCEDGRTGCAVGYHCRSNETCVAGEGHNDPLVQILPRYKLGTTDKLRQVHGLPVTKDAKLPYYSSLGDISEGVRESGKVTRVIVVVHGAGRNADDYFCSAMAILEQQSNLASDSVLVIAPRFPVPTDTDLDLSGGGIAVRWKDDGSGPWRYGGDAIWPEYARNYSSYNAMDQIVSIVSDRSRFPNIQHVAIIGHSSGGQFVQRWSLLTAHWDHRFRAVVANPSSYAYLFPMRFYDGQWQRPSLADCPQYNQWEWGLDRGGSLVAPYVEAVLNGTDISHLTQRFAARQVVYLSGSQDICNVTGHEDGWCYSHGLEATCMDEIQGSNRLERNLRYFLSLSKMNVPHLRMVISGVGHDHSLMFNSANGLRAIFRDLDETLQSPRSSRAAADAISKRRSESVTFKT
jgi:pimeloyl-ACP methyl ester carboxylesterase